MPDGDFMKSYCVPAIVRANDILTSLSQQELSFVELINQTGLPRSSLYGIVKTLEDLGFIRLQANKKYSLGFRLFELGSLSVAGIDLRKEAIPIMLALVEKEQLTAHLGSLDSKGAFYLAKQQPSNALLVNSWEGKRASFTASGIGKALMAFQPQKQVEQYLGQLPTTPGGLGKFRSLDELWEEYRAIRSRGWALDDGEDSPHIRCVAAPIRDVTGKVTASLSLTGPVLDIPDERIPQLVTTVLQAAEDISRLLGA